MIFAWFYPKELKDVIADLRAKEDLNQEAVDETNRKIISMLSLSALIFGLAMYAGDFWLGAAFFLFSLIIWKVGIHSYYRKCLGVYLFGKSRPAVVLDAWIDLYNGGWIKCQALDTHKIYKLTPLRELQSRFLGYHLKRPRKGEKINFFYDDEGRYGFMPSTPHITPYFCLSQTVLQGELHDQSNILQ